MKQPMNENFAFGLQQAKAAAESVAKSTQYGQFVEAVRKMYPWRFERLPRQVLDRDYLRIVDHHLQRLVPRLQPGIDPTVRRVAAFGLRSGGPPLLPALA